VAYLCASCSSCALLLAHAPSLTLLVSCRLWYSICCCSMRATARPRYALSRALLSLTPVSYCWVRADRVCPVRCSHVRFAGSPFGSVGRGQTRGREAASIPHLLCVIGPRLGPSRCALSRASLSKLVRLSMYRVVRPIAYCTMVVAIALSEHMSTVSVMGK